MMCCLRNAPGVYCLGNPQAGCGLGNAWGGAICFFGMLRHVLQGQGGGTGQSPGGLSLWPLPQSHCWYPAFVSSAGPKTQTNQTNKSTERQCCLNPTSATDYLPHALIRFECGPVVPALVRATGSVAIFVFTLQSPTESEPKEPASVSSEMS